VKTSVGESGLGRDGESVREVGYLYRNYFGWVGGNPFELATVLEDARQGLGLG
jgi:hypothetical protein